MARLHLFEFEDLGWFPSSWRNYGTDFLQFTVNLFDFYKGIVPVLKKGVARSGTSQIIDIGSGGGGGWLKLSRYLRVAWPGIKIRLTDLYPNARAFKYQQAKIGGDLLSWEAQPVNAVDVPAHLRGLRTLFLSFHHFQPAEARQILQNAVDHGQPVAIFEAQQRTIGHFIQYFFSPINVLILTPFIRPFRWGRLLFTYLIPVVPLFVWWDGLVSVLRTYSLKEMRTMTKELERGNSFEWEIDKVKSGPGHIYYLLGYPKNTGQKM
jgi:hypothetical protein